MPAPLPRITIYRYGLMAWVWRVPMLAALAGGVFCVLAAVFRFELALVAVAAPLVLPSLYFGWVVAHRVDRLEDGELLVTTLLFQRRRVARSDLGKPRVKLFAQGDIGPMYAPRAWIPVRDRLPIYLDLLAEIPDRSAFGNAFGITKDGQARRR
jgi:hypothetical protein